jgi:putative lipoprotein
MDGDRLTVGPIATTRMACAPEAMEAEDAFLAALGGAARLVVSEDALVLADEDGQELLRFAPHEPEASASTWSEREEPGWS